jgi:hypothetical protein
MEKTISPFPFAATGEEKKEINSPIPRNLVWRDPNPKDSIY